MLESTYRLKYNHLKYFIGNNCVEKEHSMRNWGDRDTVMCKTFVTGLYIWLHDTGNAFQHAAERVHTFAYNRRK